MTLSRQFALFLIPAWLMTVLVLGSLIVSYGLSRAESLLEDTELELLDESAHDLQLAFDEIPRAHSVAQESMTHWRDTLSDADVEERFNASFEKKPDGTWRSRESLFEGGIGALGQTSGIGAFVAPGLIDTPAKRDLVAVLSAIITVAPGQRHLLESLWFVTPRGDLVIFAPDRADRLDYYRRQAPAETDFRTQPFVKAAMPAENPQGRTRCTGLNRAAFDPSRETLITSCQTPSAGLKTGVGIWGTSLLMNQRLAQIVTEKTPTRIVALAASDGTLVAGPGFTGNEGVASETVAAVSEKLHWPAVQKNLTVHDRSSVIDVPSLPWLAVYRRIEGPEFFLVHFRDRKAIAAQLSADLPLLIVVALLLLFGQVLLGLLVVRGGVVKPLQALSRKYSANKPSVPASGLRTATTKEIAELEQQLGNAWGEIGRLVEGLELRVTERTADLSAALEETKRANLAKDQFLANVSHEIRTPLNSVVAVSGALLKSDLDSRQRQLVHILRAGGETLTLVVSDILDAAKLEAGKIELIEAPFGFVNLIEEISLGFQVMAAEKGVAFAFHHELKALHVFVGDAHRIKQIVSNLLSNAIKFTDVGEVRVTLAIEASENSIGWTTLAVEDTGIGFDPALTETLFQRFEQADSSITRRFGGSGLGLAISRALAELMGGSLTATSHLGVGSRFVLRLPLKQLPSSGADITVRAGDLAGQITIALPPDLRILVVEDHPRNQQVMQIMLEGLGANVVCAGSGLDGVELRKSQHFDLILMDKQMPGVDGLTATRMIRAHEHATELSHTPIIMVTASTSSEHVAQALEAGCDAHVAKPVAPETLCRTMAEVLRSAQNSAKRNG